MRILVTGQAQSGSYTKQDGTKVYYTEFVVSEQYFVERRTEGQQPQENDDFVDMPEDMQEELPFN
jgi:single-strand DNA-binding protein